MKKMMNNITQQTGQQLAYDNNAKVIHIRLDTQKLKDSVRRFLTGKEIISQVNPETKREEYVEITFGEAKCNKDGVQSILSYVEALSEPIVQGNFIYDETTKRSEMYSQYIYDFHTSITKDIIQNCYNWEIKEYNLRGIIRFIMLLVEPFMSRLIDNKERESYSESIKSVETNSVQQKGSGFSLTGN